MSSRQSRQSKRNTKPDTASHEMASTILYEWWYAIAEEIFEKVCAATELDPEQKEALRAVALRPNDFQIEIDN